VSHAQNNRPLLFLQVPDYASDPNTNQANNGETHLDDNSLRSSTEYRSFARKNMAANVQDVIILLGDSITKGGWAQGGFAPLLAERYVRKLDVLNRGFIGYQTDWAIPACEEIFAKQHERLYVPKVKLLTIWYGANDAAPAPSTHHVPRDRFKENLSHLVQMVKLPTSPYYSPETGIILITPPPLNTKQWARPEYPRLFEYAEAVKEVGEKENVPVADIWTAIFDGAG
ncbi:hypothetical protein AZE42_06382, partial [Rhizopogon vesiculosus]